MRPVPQYGNLALYRVLDSNAGIGLPIDVVTKPDDTRMYIVDFSGSVRIFENGALQVTPFLDLSATVYASLSTGLRGFAFHPDYANNGTVFASYDVIDSNQQVYFGIARLQRSTSNPDQIDTSTFVELLREFQPLQGHASSRLAFGPDGMLYAALGDGGQQSDPLCNSQNHGSLLGTMLRLDVDSGFPYAIPPDNPFLSDPSIRDEAWLLGMRHPWRWGFDPFTGALWISDVGQSSWEEINVVPPGQGGFNFGWSVMEGSECFTPSACPPGALPCNDPGYTEPTFQYDHSAGNCSIIGGLPYRGRALPAYAGRYFFSDFCSRRLYSLAYDGQQAHDLQDHTAGLVSLNGGALNRPVAFARDNAGELLIMDFADNEIYRLVSDCFIAPFCPQGPNSTGTAATLTASGLPSPTLNDLRLHVQGLPPGTMGHVFYGATAGMGPLGAGTLCIETATSPYYRLPTFVANPLGRAHYRLDLNAPPTASGPLLVGSRWYFQSWYRDPGAPSNNASQLTDALEIFICD